MAYKISSNLQSNKEPYKGLSEFIIKSNSSFDVETSRSSIPESARRTGETGLGGVPIPVSLFILS